LPAVIVFKGEPRRKGVKKGPPPEEKGGGTFCQEVGVIYRRKGGSGIDETNEEREEVGKGRILQKLGQ